MAVVNVFFIFVHFTYFLVEDKLASPYWHLNDTPVDVASRAMATIDFWTALILTVPAALFPRSGLYIFFRGSDKNENAKSLIIISLACKVSAETVALDYFTLLSSSPFGQDFLKVPPWSYDHTQSLGTSKLDIKTKKRISKVSKTPPHITVSEEKTHICGQSCSTFSISIHPLTRVSMAPAAEECLRIKMAVITSESLLEIGFCLATVRHGLFLQFWGWERISEINDLTSCQWLSEWSRSTPFLFYPHHWAPPFVDRGSLDSTFDIQE